MIKLGEKCPQLSTKENIVYCFESCPEWNGEYCFIERDVGDYS